MQIANFQLPTKQDGFKSPLKTRVKFANKPAYRSHSSNVNPNGRGMLQVFKGHEANRPSKQDGPSMIKPQEFSSKTFKDNANSSTLYSQKGHYDRNSNANVQIVQSNILYQGNQFNVNPQVKSYFTNPKPGNNNRVNPSDMYIRGNSFTELNKSKEYGGTRKQEMNDNISVHSKVSTTSRNQLLRPVSINNEDHLYNLINKEERLAAANKEIINNFIKNVNTTKYNVVTNMSQNFKQRITEIWKSYLAEQQKNMKINKNVQDLDRDVNKITACFQENLSAKTQNYIELLKEKSYKDLYASITEKNNVKHYLDNDIKNLIENDFNSLKTKNQKLKEELRETKQKFQTQIDQTSQKYEKLRETHMDAYDREFCFKLNGDDKLVRDTLLGSIPLLQNKNRKLDEKLKYIQSKSDTRSINNLKAEIASLEAKINA